MLRRISVICALLVFTTPSPAADSQKMYKWTDDQGEVHYSQFPPPGRKTEKLQPPPPPPESPNASGNDLQQQLDAVEQQNQEQLQGAKDAQQWAQIQKIRRDNCKTAHQNLDSLQRSGNVRYMGPDGKVMRLTEEERQKRIDETNAQIKENCNP
jgi:hypothetical protein